MTDAPTSQPETKRDRVRRLLIAPAQERGMRFPKRMPADEQVRRLNRLCDELTYLTDDELAALADWIVRHGDGSDRSFWPPHVGIVSTAETYHPLPLEEVPVIASWFASRAGEAALDGQRLVAEFLWFEQNKRPPRNAHEKARIADYANQLNDEIARIEERLGRGREPAPGGREQLEWYRRIEARARALVEAGKEKRTEQGDVA